MITLEQAACALAVPCDADKFIRRNFIAGGIWMRAQILQMMNKASMDFKDEQAEVIDQFCDKIYEQLKEIE